MESLSVLPEPGSPNYAAELYLYAATRTPIQMERHVFTCILFCLLGRKHSPEHHLLLRTSRQDIGRLRQMVVDILTQVFGLSTVYLRFRRTTTTESLETQIVSPDLEDTAPSTNVRSRRKSSINQRLSSHSHSRPGRSSVGRASVSSTRHMPELDMKAEHQEASTVLPQALVVTSLGRASHETQEHFYEILRTSRVASKGDEYILPKDLFVVVLNDIGDWRERPAIAACLLDRFTFSSYVEVLASDSPDVRVPSDTNSVVPAEYLSKLTKLPLPCITPFLDIYIGNLLTATFQHPLLSCPFFGPRTRAAFKHFACISALMFSGTAATHANQEDIARVYVHVVGHRISVRGIGEGLLGILDRTAAPLPDEDNCWKPGMKRRETTAQLLRDIINVV